MTVGCLGPQEARRRYASVVAGEALPSWDRFAVDSGREAKVTRGLARVVLPRRSTTGLGLVYFTRV